MSEITFNTIKMNYPLDITNTKIYLNEDKLLKITADIETPYQTGSLEFIF